MISFQQFLVKNNYYEVTSTTGTSFDRLKELCDLHNLPISNADLHILAGGSDLRDSARTTGLSDAQLLDKLKYHMSKVQAGATHGHQLFNPN